MEEYLNTPIKELISRFPVVGKILEEYDIGCVPCNIGSCLFKDIMEIHNLPEEEEQELMAKIAKAIYPDRVIQIPRIERKAKARSQEIRYSPPIKKLVDEHVLIKRCIALIPQVSEYLDVESAEDRKVLYGIADFIRSYADKFHHAKEEEILFKYFDESLDILKTMLEDHHQARGHVMCLLDALEIKDKNEIVKHLGSYRDLLTEHIKKEDEILYPWIDRNLSVKQVGELFSKFSEVDEITGNDVVARCGTFVNQLESKLTSKKEVGQWKVAQVQ